MTDLNQQQKPIKANTDNDLLFRVGTVETPEQRNARLRRMAGLPMKESGKRDAGGETEYITD